MSVALRLRFARVVSPTVAPAERLVDVCRLYPRLTQWSYPWGRQSQRAAGLATGGRSFESKCCDGPQARDA
eukprot:CAMPEP_0177791326 /NCGR_PEP_ID=MMETSP0491_2-20121128/23865_1 /TAXON_ID=63592 /ORGANISM="Tetraselmis chuii, Strain PLY429" /LENGTH=70 /DNA_ID=CAMNT_0019313533 /DNA_START=422 /DNA_END=630 /DNA_ORIENTATION=-